MFTNVNTLLGAEMIRDGGSLAVSFCDERNAEWIVFLPLRSIDHGDRMERLGFDEPLLIDASPENRPADSPGIQYSKLSGLSQTLSWVEAQALALELAARSAELDQRAAEYLTMLCFAINRQGELPPSMDRFLRNGR
ncbi:hypothetical protein [Bradyrhizobium sp. SRS-191]|uniref:hypothetical protein n=1 Tax=Bradyrhizobium sp. SRS-191 TaxID=2962606 RepID=UPI00211E3690|nr:hypothetical protein [Bradyrhizobium sp. SRS-191]